MTCSIMHDDSWTVKKIITCHGNNAYKQEQVEQKYTLCKLFTNEILAKLQQLPQKDKMMKIAIKKQHFTHVSLILSLKQRLKCL